MSTVTRPSGHVAIVGGGTAGLTVAAWLRKESPELRLTLIEPSEVHYYQPLWTLVGGGVVEKEASVRPEADFIPEGVTWIKARVATFQPEENRVTLDNGETVPYDALIVAPGIQLDWDKIEGLRESLGKNGVCSNYSYDTVDSTWKTLRELRGGTALFTFPNTPIKCAGAPQKILWLTEHYLQKNGRRKGTKVVFASAGGAIFGVPRYARTLARLAVERDVETRFGRDLVAVNGAKKEAVFKHLDTGETEVVSFEMLHVTPPQSAPDFVKRSPLANAAGWVDVDKHSLQHTRFPNVFSLGDASSLPCSKTAAAVRKQAPVCAQNLASFLAGQPLTGHYDGYASCPLVTGYGRLILAEFGYDGKILETMPFDQSQERYSLYATKAYLLPRMYWHGMLRARW